MTRRPFSHLPRRRFLQGTAALGITLTAMPRSGWAAEEKLINVYNWDTYIGETTLDTFTGSTGIKVQYDLYANNEELFAKLKAGNPGYDVIFPSDYMVESMIATNMLEEIDHAKIPNIKHIDPNPNFSNPAFNPGLKFGVPYFWGTMGIGYRISKVDGVPDSWGDILDSDKYAGRIALLEDQRAMIGFTLKYLGFPMNSINPEEIAKARDLLIKNKKNFKTFAPDSGQDLLLSGEVDLAVEWNGDIVQIMEEDDDIAYVVPKEGGMVWVDNICIPTGAPHPDNAHAFINHIHDPVVNAEIANTIHYPTANLSAQKMVLPADLVNPAIYPPPETLARCEQIVDVGDATRLYDEAWTAIKAS
jgi:spermidine/putrescine transport system substrate-binding protein